MRLTKVHSINWSEIPIPRSYNSVDEWEALIIRPYVTPSHTVRAFLTSSVLLDYIK